MGGKAYSQERSPLLVVLTFTGATEMSTLGKTVLPPISTSDSCKDKHYTVIVKICFGNSKNVKKGNINNHDTHGDHTTIIATTTMAQAYHYIYYYTAATAVIAADTVTTAITTTTDGNRLAEEEEEKEEKKKERRIGASIVGE